MWAVGRLEGIDCGALEEQALWAARPQQGHQLFSAPTSIVKHHLEVCKGGASVS